jgi:hypothetical protein
VNFVLGHPTLVPIGALSGRSDERRLQGWLRGCTGFDPAPPGQARVVALPVDQQYAVLLWELTPTPALDRRIRERGWATAEVRLLF